LLDTSGVLDFDAVFLAALRDADAFVLASREAADGDDEGGPALTAVAAQAVGVPIVVTSYPGSEQHVEDRQTGTVVPQRAPQALADAILRVAADLPRAQTMAAVAAGTVRADFSRERLLAAMRIHYERVAGR
jgi:glycosyltransferase involved in cell wall biosynthesis